jgi:hypothetical protein
VFNRSRVDRASRSRRALLKLLGDVAQLRAVGFRSAHVNVAEHLLTSRLDELPRLRVNALALAAR